MNLRSRFEATMPASPLESRLDAIVKPLAFAAADDFSHLQRVRDLEPSVAKACHRLLESPAPALLREVVSKVAEVFAGEPAADETIRIAAIRRALGWLEPFRTGDWQAQALAAPLSVLPGVGPRPLGSAHDSNADSRQTSIYYPSSGKPLRWAFSRSPIER